MIRCPRIFDRLTSRTLHVCGLGEDQMRRTGLLSLCAAAMFVVGGCSNSDERKAPASETPKGAAIGTGGVAANTKDDGDFVRDVAIMNMAEIQLSRMALEKATGPDVKMFAQTLIDDHTAAGDGRNRHGRHAGGRTADAGGP